ncbi:winged helix-turn-helix domain-containing protein [Aquimonas voraii]|uniref:DNA-binding winged helix-turn-helix (WHTH) domain-containing protein n=1 Tax=Aquimonas voraii TaxID=265719 RepID=A0A1G6ZLI7_9GAMM|nr:winged helix-turn-helix domain-containing protein [Aquimonas voraii]SDE03313.1 DNA-binding winged helix-turn-helix (wHTH) domain-containing protein [Aquimonas voraii]
MSELHAAADADLQIGDWRLTPATHRLSRDGDEKRLTRLQVQLLLALAERPGQSWSRQALIERVWPRRMVADEVLSRAIAQLRLLLADDARQPRYIETLHGTGYRLLAAVGPVPVEALPAAGPPAPAMPATAAMGRRRHAAVLGLLAATIGVLGIGLLALGALQRDPSPARGAADVTQRIAAAQSFMSAAGVLRQPRFSADARQVLWIDTASGRIEVAERSGRRLHSLSFGAAQAGSAAFAADGQSVYALLQTPQGCSLVEVLLSAPTSARTLSACRQAGLGVAVDADGSLLFTGPQGGLQRHPRNGRAEQTLTHPDCAGCVDSQPRLAEGRLAFLRGRPEAQAIWLQQAAGPAQQLAGGDDRVTDLAFAGALAKGSNALLVASNAWGSPGLLQIDPIDGALRWLGARGAYGVDVAADGSLLLELRQVQSPLWLQRADAAPQRLTQSLRDDSQPALSPDGRRVAFVSNRSGNGGIWLLDLDSGSETLLALPAARAWTRPAWSGDGQRLWLSRYADAGVQAVQIDAATARLLPTPEPLAARAAERVFERGPGDYLVQVLEGEQRLLRWQLGAQGGAIAASRGVGAWASDGEWLVFQTAGARGLWRWRWSDPEAPAQPVPVASEGGWTVHRGRLWWFSDAPQGRLQHRDLATGATRVWSEHFGAAPRELQVLDDGAAVLFSRVLRIDSELMLYTPAD